MTSPRIAPGRTIRELGPVNWVVCRIVAKLGGVEEGHLFTTMGRTGGLFRGWLFYSSKLMPGGRISRKDTETIILRVAHLRECGYELDHHIRLGKRAGVDDELRERIFAGPDAAGLDARQRVFLAAADEMVSTKTISDDSWAALARVFDDKQLVEFVLLVTQYDGLASTIGTLRIERDY
ncbi:4-carboxymuconolactone decarboxylase [Rhodococcus sp. Leaf7]|uniref:carboxymuconolactone decarboxylase family protein n=1 Tax=unclassified Rhodococcus (in: high G+C Gram-positive bacteria) TaxID=192944 RepID=UPI0005AD1DF9|nr:MULTISPECIES: carboxymuconolactone decarboxylase family protein [unclassified Rhodococcus (in: high G+C Gram-positive bacteria)]KIQ16812.1 4-carboxymuconolactone decarboxylase [Rhodococcus sp. MEB064]KQU04248.1 4-carboxymuconolactone decarboxylase [Rhodococcus sp. Leaf7]KQU40433.1 4-carboxymuconolactone decarboxylase [Rhodococcus sp. Leaf247]